MPDRPQITRDNFIDSLRTMMPNFEIDPLWVEDDPLDYPIINDFGRYVCEQMRSGNIDELKNGIGFLERLLESRNSYLRDLVHECLETLNLAR